jgi:DNA polymerase-3 subunit epsilon
VASPVPDLAEALLALCESLAKDTHPVGVHLPNRMIDVSKLYYERKYATAPPGTRIDLRYSSILADLKLPALPQHDAFVDAVGAAEIYLVLDDLRKRGVWLPRAPAEASAHFSFA